MRPDRIEIGGAYTCRIDDAVVPVRVDAKAPRGWEVTVIATGQAARVQRAEQFRDPWPPTEPKPEEAPPPRNGATEPLDPNRCATARCRNEPVMTYLGRPLCQACWRAESGEPDEDGAASAAKENDMSKKQTSKKASKSPKASKPTARKASKTAKARGAKQVPKPEVKPERVSALDAAAEVLRTRGEALRSRELIAAMAEQGLWTSPNGKTPHATLYAAMLREIAAKGKEARFRKTERGKFEYAGGGK